MQRQHAFTLDDALACGLRARQCGYRVSTGQWIAVFRGVYRLAGPEPDWRGLGAAACKAAPGPAAISHRSALAIYDLPGARRHVTEISTPRWRRARHVGLVVHETRAWSPDDVDVSDVPVTLPARTLIDAAAVLHESTLELAVDEALRRDLVAFAELWRRVEELSQRGRRGIGVLKAVLARRHPQADLAESVREHLLFKALRDAGLPDPVLQYEIVDHAGNLLARPDIAYPRIKVAIEYDSYLHHGGRAKYVRDLGRRNDLTALGWRVLHVTGPDLQSGAIDLCRALRSLLIDAA